MPFVSPEIKTATMVCPIMEYRIDIQTNINHFDKNKLIPKNSRITLPDLPGLGIALDAFKVVSMKKIWPEGYIT